MGLIERPTEPQLKVLEERGVTRSDAGTFIFGLARNASDCTDKLQDTSSESPVMKEDSTVMTEEET